ncbi:MAG TPA: beta-carotene hydroxylase [Myxococcales bacterium]|nr:beta-carotene hydroxylase [Myxococcales bacterium]HAN31868.1 beta-carotene hydroxylase [Myxococcales bacterium]
MWTSWQFWIPLVVAFFAMEVWSLVVHKMLWHGSLWWGHESHHVETDGYFETNDLFAIFHAVIAAPMIYFGMLWQVHWVAGLGFGMTVFGFCYGVVHDGLVHGRLPVAFLARIPYLRRVRSAHMSHHGTNPHSPPFGLFLGPWEMRRYHEQRQRQRRRSDAGRPLAHRQISKSPVVSATVQRAGRSGAL